MALSISHGNKMDKVQTRPHLDLVHLEKAVTSSDRMEKRWPCLDFVHFISHAVRQGPDFVHFISQDYKMDKVQTKPPFFHAALSGLCQDSGPCPS
jgi:hypothetical protein